MTTILFVLQIILVLLLVGAVLIQQTGADSLGGLSGGGHNMLSQRSTSDALSKTTILLSVLFLLNCLAIAKSMQTTPNTHHSIAQEILEKSKSQELDAPEVKD